MSCSCHGGDRVGHGFRGRRLHGRRARSAAGGVPPSRARDHQGNPEIYKSLWSRRADVTLANPFGPPVRGWEEVSARLDLAASNYRDGRDYDFENISTVVTPELAYTVEIERIRTCVGGSDELTAIAIRATTVFRREDGTWRVTHRHGDPITSMRPAESVARS